METKETELAIKIANLVEDHWFNPAQTARYLAAQPHWSLDRIMELVAWVIEKQARRYDEDLEQGKSSEGTWLAKQLDEVINDYKIKYEWQNIKLP